MSTEDKRDPLPRRKRALRRELLRLREVRGVYECGACLRLVPLGFAHRRTQGTEGCEVVVGTDNGGPPS